MFVNRVQLYAITLYLTNQLKGDIERIKKKEEHGSGKNL